MSDPSAPEVTPNSDAPVAPKKSKHRRNRSLVDREVQGGMLRKLALHWSVLFVCNSMALMIWVRLFEQPDAAWSETFQDVIRRYLPFFIVTMALIPAFVWDTLKLTNRFAGPIMRLRSSLAAVRSGRSVSPLHFRQSDFWQEMAEDFNAIAHKCQVVMTSDPGAKVDEAQS
ncbi:MAG: hypothetical protein AAGA03_05290 [Planctomycetota bacterium]